MKKKLKRRVAAIARTLREGLGRRVRWKQLDDDAGIDEVRIRTVPRYKTSGLSGDGWRISATLELLRKGVVIWSGTYSTVATALLHAPWIERILCELDLEEPEHGRFTEAGKKRVEEGLGAVLETECAQPGCAEPAVTVYRLKKEYCRRDGHELPREPDDDSEERRAFCARHADRGDCGIEDANRNYDVLEGRGPEGAHKVDDDESPSATVIVE